MVDNLTFENRGDKNPPGDKSLGGYEVLNQGSSEVTATGHDKRQC